MWVFRTLPFGWSYSPLLCQRFLAHLVGKVVQGGRSGVALDALFGQFFGAWQF